MKVVAAIYAYNIYKTGRAPYFEETIKSINAPGDTPDDHVYVTCGSDDGTDRRIKELGGIVDNKVNAPWYGMEICINTAIEKGADVVVLHADDMTFKPGWLADVKNFWGGQPKDARLLSLYLEPDYDWNKPKGTIVSGGVKAIRRQSVCGSSWTFLAKDWPDIGPIPPIFPGEDVTICKILYSRNLGMYAIDKAIHAGEKNSAWGNQSWRQARPFNKRLWGLK